jgi:hypothetical protein
MQIMVLAGLHDRNVATPRAALSVFGKASNMNYSLVLSLEMAEIIRRLEVECGEKAPLADSSAPSDDGGEDIEDQALRLAVEEIYEESGRALRMGEVILIVDSDTVVVQSG